jgi:hypothetical protein
VILLIHLLSTTPQLHLDTWHMDALTTQLTLQVTSTQALVHCPICRFPTRRVHSRYIRTVTALPWALWPVAGDGLRRGSGQSVEFHTSVSDVVTLLGKSWQSVSSVVGARFIRRMA